MDSVLLDTNVISFYEKCDSRATLYDKHLSGKRHVVCFMSVAELYRWTIGRGWGASRVAKLRERLNKYVIVPYDDALAWEWAQISTIKGHPIAVDDAWIAAAARLYRLPLVTHNRKHFERIPGLDVISEAP